jgi:glucose-6-phosphate isomerase
MSNLGLNIEDNRFSQAEVEVESKLLERVQKHIRGWQNGKMPPFMAILDDKAALKTVKKWRKKISKRAERLIVFGIGGSSLGAEMLVNGLKSKKGLPVEFYDNVDPDSLSSLNRVDWKKSFLLVVSKSGSTAETLSQFLTTLPALQSRLGAKINQHVAIITENIQSDLGKIANSLNLPIINHPAVGGRFSALSVVGLLPAAVAGVDVEKVLDGARAMRSNCLLPYIKLNPALQGAANQYLMAQAGKNISVYMSYGQKLNCVAAWQSQLLGESLGKTDKKGQSHGLTPVAARGVTDQHSQLQLYLDGPGDKQFTLFYDPQSVRKGKKIGKKFKKLKSVEPLAGRTTGSLFTAEFLGTRDALINRQLPVRTLNVTTGDSSAFGEMIILLESETVIMAEFLNIDAYDQPAVEDSKVRARAYLTNKQALD